MFFLASLLLKEGATPLILATQSGHIDTVQYLIGAGADINLPSAGDTQQNTALWYAVSYAIRVAQDEKDVYEKIIFLLISRGADPTLVNKVSGCNLL